jgi:endoglucanase
VAGYEAPAEQTVSITANQTRTLSGTYTVKAGKCSLTPPTNTPLTSSPLGLAWRCEADVGEAYLAIRKEEPLFVGGVPPTGARSQELPPGQYTLTVRLFWRASGPWRDEDVLTHTYPVDIRMETGTLAVTTTPVAGPILVDGVVKGTGSWSGLVPVGARRVSFGAVAGYEAPAEQTVSITANQTRTLSGTYTVKAGKCSLISPPMGLPITTTPVTITWRCDSDVVEAYLAVRVEGGNTDPIIPIVGSVPPTGTRSLELPPGQYTLIVRLFWRTSAPWRDEDVLTHTYPVAVLPPTALMFFHTVGRDIVADATGQKVAFRAVNLNGLEFGRAFDNPYPGIEGTNYFQPRPEDFVRVKALGFNAIRVPFEWARLVPGWHPSMPSPAALNASYLAILDNVVSMAAQQGLQVIPDMHDFLKYWSGPSKEECVDNANPAYQELLVETWRLLATHFKDNPAVLGYDIMNEPVRREGTELCGSCNWARIAQAIVDAIRTVDVKHLIFVEGKNYSLASDWRVENGGTPFVVDRITPPRLVYSPHVFFDFKNDSQYDSAGEGDGPIGSWEYVVRDRLRPVIDWSIANNVPLFIGETGVPCSERWAAVLEHVFRNYIEPLRLSVGIWHYIDPQRSPLRDSPLNLLACPQEHQLNVLKQFPGGPYVERGTPALIPTDSRIYDDSRVNPWDAGTGLFGELAVNFCESHPVFEGTCSTSVRFNRDNFDGVKFIHHTSVDSRWFQTLAFRIYLTGTGAQNFKLFTTAPQPDCDGPGPDPEYPSRYADQPELRSFLPTPTVGQWQEVRIPLTRLVNPGNPMINGIAFRNLGANQDIFYLDNIRLLP